VALGQPSGFDSGDEEMMGGDEIPLFCGGIPISHSEDIGGHAVL